MSVNLLTVKDIRPYLAGELKDLFYDEAEIAALARILVKTIFRGAGLHHVYNSSMPLTAPKVNVIKEMTAELKSGKPYQYVIGETEFCGCTIKVRPGVLIPRPETEELSDLIIRENKGFKGRIADFGTGSGCIAIALATGLPGSEVTGYDNSPEALEIASENAMINKAAVTFRHFDIIHSGAEGLNQAGIIVSNPPYVLNSEKTLMRKNVLGFEPHQALFVDDDNPILFYRRIAEIAAEILVKGGLIYFEINESMGVRNKALLEGSGFMEVKIIKDLNNKDRFIKAIKK